MKITMDEVAKDPFLRDIYLTTLRSLTSRSDIPTYDAAHRAFTVVERAAQLMTSEQERLDRRGETYG